MSIDNKNLPPGLLRAMRREPALRQSTMHPMERPSPKLNPPQKKRVPGLSKPRKKKAMNDTEAAFSLRLMAQKQAGEITRWDREGVTLRLNNGLAYTADFSVWKSSPIQLVLIETKGPFIREDARVKFLAFQSSHPEIVFEMWQRKKGAWEKVL